MLRSLLLLLLLPLAATAQVPVAPSCNDSAPHRVFDFWIGDWEVRNADGRLLGHNTISAEVNGCVLTERWTNARGMPGMSLNYWDPVKQKWVQSWMSANGAVFWAEGTLTNDGAMAMEGAWHRPDGTRQPSRLTLTPLPDGRVRQLFEAYDEATDAWTPQFEGFYQRIEG